MIKKFIKCLIIYVVVFMTMLSSISYGYTSSEIGSAVAGFSKNFVETGNQGTGPDGKVGFLRYSLNDANWSKVTSIQWNTVLPASDGMYWFCCATFVSNMYEAVTGLQIRTHSSAGVKSWAQSHGEAVSLSSVQPGDILYRTRAGGGHVAIYIGNNQIAQASTANSEPPAQVNISSYSAGAWQSAYRISDATASSVFNLDTTFTISGIGGVTGVGTMSGIDFSEFFFNGIPDRKYSVATTNIFEVVIDTLASIADYIVGILTYIIRIVFVGFTGLADNLLNWTANTISSTGVDSSELNINSVEIENIEKDSRKLTIESLLYNEYDLFDINIFDFNNN